MQLCMCIYTRSQVLIVSLGLTLLPVNTPIRARGLIAVSSAGGLAVHVSAQRRQAGTCWQ